jgi:hypothetical protein
LFSGVLEEKVFVDQSPVHHAGGHIPIAGHHAHQGVFIAARRTDLHSIFHRRRFEMIEILFAGLAQARLAAQLVKTKQQIGLIVRDFSHNFLRTF